MKNTLVITLVLVWFLTGSAFAEGDAAAGKDKTTACAACHGADGNSVNPEWPKLAGQGAKYLYTQLKLFKEGKRKNPLMSPQAASLSDQDMQDIAAYYSSQTPTQGAAQEDMVERGGEIYRGGIAKKDTAACMACHGPRGTGNPPAMFPRVSGQHAAYMANALKAYRSGERKSDETKMMNAVTERLTDDDIAAVTQYMSGLH